MRRAVRDYKYEVNESRMTEECIQYLTQLQKDWERHRVKMGVEALRKEVRQTTVLSLLALSPVRSMNVNGSEISTRTPLLTNLQVRKPPAYPPQIPPRCSTVSTSYSIELLISQRGSPLKQPRCSGNSWIRVICYHYSSHLILACYLPHQSNNIL